MEYKIRYYGDPSLRCKNEPIKKIDEQLNDFASDLIEAMYEYDGIGLAAPQIGVNKKILAYDISENKNSPRILINPEILEEEGEQIMEEGCLSFPGIYGKIKRPLRIKIKAKTLNGQEHIIELKDIEARVVLHENDHLNGVLFIDRMTPSHKVVIKPKLKKLEKQTKEDLKNA